MSTTKNLSSIACQKSVAAGSAAIHLHGSTLGIEGDAGVQLWHLLASLHEWSAANGVDFDAQLSEFRATLATGELNMPAAQAVRQAPPATAGEGLFELGVSLGDKIKSLLDADPTLQPRGRQRALTLAWSSIKFGAASAMLESMIDVPDGEETLKAVFGSGGVQALNAFAEVGLLGFKAALRAPARA